MAQLRLGSTSGFWQFVGENDDDGMRSNWVPHNDKGKPVAVSQKANGYWSFHLPGSGKGVYFHRQLFEDLRSAGPLPSTHEVHHKDFDRNDNMTENLELLTKKRHRQLTAEYKRSLQETAQYQQRKRKR